MRIKLNAIIMTMAYYWFVGMCLATVANALLPVSVPVWAGVVATILIDIVRGWAYHDSHEPSR